MIKKLTLLFISFLSFFSIFSQTVFFEPSEKYLGTTFGMNHSMIMFNPSINQKIPFLGYNGGISFRYITEKHVGLQIELKYAQRGWSDIDNNYVRQINYVEIPFLTHIYIGNTHRIIFNLGPKIGYKISDSVRQNANPSFDYAEYVKDIRYPFDYGLAAGIGYNLHTRNLGVFELEARGNYGLSDVFANSKSDYFSTSNHLNIAVNLGWYLQLSGKK